MMRWRRIGGSCGRYDSGSGPAGHGLNERIWRCDSTVHLGVHDEGFDDQFRKDMISGAVQ